MKHIAIITGMLLAFGCGGTDKVSEPAVEEPSVTESPAAEPPAEEPEPAAQPESIGSATMKDDGTIVLMLRAEGPGGIRGDALIEYKKGDPKYQETLDHLGGLKPGEEKPVPPWPER